MMMNNERKIGPAPSDEKLNCQVKQIVQPNTNSFDSSADYVPWNIQFHKMLELCDLTSLFPARDLPPSYERNNICGHVFKVKQQETERHTN